MTAAPLVTLAVGRIAFPNLTLTDMRLELPVGKTTCLLGPSGVGKSTLIRAFAGVLPRDGHSFHLAPDPLPIVAWMGQGGELLPWLSVLDNVLIGARLRGWRVTGEDRKRAQGLLVELGLGEATGHRLHQLSGGMRQRVALARTLFEDAPLVLLDEPFNALDFPTRWRLQALTAERLRGKTVLLVTHDPLEALRLAHKIVVLNGAMPCPSLISFAMPPGEPPRETAQFIDRQGDLIGLIGPVAANL